MTLSGRVLLLALLVVGCMLMPTHSFASSSSSDYSNVGGTISGTNAGLTLTGSTLVAVNGSGGLITGDLGTVSFNTGALTSGSLNHNATFGAGGSFTINGNGMNGIPNGVLFSGTFTGTSTWTLTTLSNGTHNYTLVGEVDGTAGGMSVNGVTEQLTINTGKGFFDGSTTISGGDTTVVAVASVPEPSSLALFGTGTLALGGLLRRKLRFTR